MNRIEEQRKIIGKLRRSCLIKIGGLIAALAIIFVFFAGITPIRTESMAPVFHEGDLVFFLRTPAPVCGDMILYRTGEGGGVGQVMRERRDDGCLVVRTDHRLDPSDPSAYTQVPGASVKGTILTVIRRAK